MRVKLALHKGQKHNLPFLIVHVLICIVLSIRYLKICKYSHSELIIDGICYSSMAGGGGVRAAVLNMDRDEWDIFDCPNVDADAALARFEKIKGQGYDWLGAVSWAIPFAKHRPTRYSCFETDATMLEMENAHRQGPFELIKEATK